MLSSTESPGNGFPDRALGFPIVVERRGGHQTRGFVVCRLETAFEVRCWRAGGILQAFIQAAAA